MRFPTAAVLVLSVASSAQGLAAAQGRQTPPTRTPDPAAIDQARERVEQLERERDAVNREARQLGEGPDITRSIQNVRNREAREVEQIQRLEEAIERMGGTKAELEQVRQEMEDKSVFDDPDKNKKRIATGIGKWLLGEAAKRVAAVVGVVLEVAEVGARKVIKEINVEALEDQVKRNQLTINDTYELTTALHHQLSEDRQTLRQLQDMQAREQDLSGRIAAARANLELQEDPAQPNLIRDLDTRGDEKLEYQQKLDKLRREADERARQNGVNIPKGVSSSPAGYGQGAFLPQSTPSTLASTPAGAVGFTVSFDSPTWCNYGGGSGPLRVVSGPDGLRVVGSGFVPPGVSNPASAAPNGLWEAGDRLSRSVTGFGLASASSATPTAPRQSQTAVRSPANMAAFDVRVPFLSPESIASLDPTHPLRLPGGLYGPPSANPAFAGSRSAPRATTETSEKTTTTQGPADKPTTAPENPSVPLVGLTVKATQAALTAGQTTPFAGARLKLGFPDAPLPVAGTRKDDVTASADDPIQGVTAADGSVTLTFANPGVPLSELKQNLAGPGPVDALPIDLTPVGSSILHFKAGSSVHDAQRLLATQMPPKLRTQLRLTGEYRLLGGLVTTFEYPATEGEAVAKALLTLTSSAPNLELAEPNLCREKKPGPADPYLRSRGTWKQAHDDQWAIKRVGLGDGPDSPWTRVAASGKPVVVAVIDTGLDWDHLDFARENLWTNEREIPGNGVDDDKNGYVDDVIGWDFIDADNRPWDRDGHGTFVAGVIAAAHNDVGIAGINPRVKIMALRALNDFGHTRASYLAQAIVYAANNGARVINLSAGGKGLTKTEQMAIGHARSRGALVIVAAGNEAEDAGTYGPAGATGVIAVAATGFDDRRVAFSNWGPHVDIAAPGLDVLSLRARATDLMRDIPGVEYTPGAAYVGADRRYYRASGTSFSAPIVAGVASLVWSLRPELTADEVRRVLLQSARDVDAPGRDQYTGYGLVDAQAALRADPRFFLETEISGVRVAATGGQTVVEVSGTADADRFRSARLEIGAGGNPQAWKAIGAALSRSVRSGVLAAIPAQALAGAKEWTIRLVAEHENGSRREARFNLKLE
jgi:subtilisin family serine protease